MSTDGISRDSTRVKITDMLARLGKSQHTEVQPAKITTDDIRNAMRRLGETRDEAIKTFDFEPPKLSDEQQAKLMEQLKKQLADDAKLSDAIGFSASLLSPEDRKIAEDAIREGRDPKQALGLGHSKVLPYIITPEDRKIMEDAIREGRDPHQALRNAHSKVLPYFPGSDEGPGIELY